MSSENCSRPPPQPVPISTVYPGNYQGSVNYGFQHPQGHPQGHPQAYPQSSPPKYEDVVNGYTTNPEPHRTYEIAEQAVIYVTPVKYTATQKALGIVFTILFLVGFLSVLIKILSFQ